ncbi:MAG: chemotaxis protein CheW, partial [Armatimonadota bacterium]
LLTALDVLKLLKESIQSGTETSDSPVAAAVEAVRAVGYREEAASAPPAEPPNAQPTVPPKIPRAGKAFRVRVEFSEDCQMPSVRAFMVLREIDSVGTVLHSSPSKQDIEAGRGSKKLECIVETDRDESAVREAAGKVFEVDKVDVEPIELADESSPTPVDAFALLNELALLITQTDSNAPDGLTKLTERLDAAAVSNLPPIVKEFLTQAADKLHKAGTDPNAIDHALVDAGRLIEAAMTAIEDAMLAPGEQNRPEDEIAFDEKRAAEYVSASFDLVRETEEAVLALQTDPANQALLNKLLNTASANKELAAQYGAEYARLLMETTESLLKHALTSRPSCPADCTNCAKALLNSCDMLRALLSAYSDFAGGEPLAKPTGFDDLIAKLSKPASVCTETEEDPKPWFRVGDILVSQGRSDRDDLALAAVDQGSKPIGVAAVRSEAASLKDVGDALRIQQKLKSGDSGAEAFVRVRTDRLDRLIDTVGELVIAQSMVAQDQTVLEPGNHELLRKVTHTSKIVRELQDLAMSMRMVPLKMSFQKMARVVRDLAQKSGKSARLVTQGEDTEIDRNMVEVINDPLLHLVRNAVDHGLETPEEREKAGKPPTGTVLLSAYHAGGSVIIEVQDDGRGLNRERILQKAISKGLIESDKGMSDADIFNLIFEPGFSTAEKVTDVSGRGVGLDVVKAGVEALRGRVTVESEPGKGCTFRLRLPLTMAITDGMLVRVGSQRYIIPTVNIHMSLKPNPEDLHTVSGRGEMLKLRDELLPIFRLHRIFEVPNAVEELKDGLLVIVDDGSGRYALLVDELLGQQQVVAKALGEGLGKIPGISGGAILGDGRVGLIIDTQGVAALARDS